MHDQHHRQRLRRTITLDVGRQRQIRHQRETIARFALDRVHPREAVRLQFRPRREQLGQGLPVPIEQMIGGGLLCACSSRRSSDDRRRSGFGHGRHDRAGASRSRRVRLRPRCVNAVHCCRAGSMQTASGSNVRALNIAPVTSARSLSNNTLSARRSPSRSAAGPICPARCTTACGDARPRRRTSRLASSSWHRRAHHANARPSRHRDAKA